MGVGVFFWVQHVRAFAAETEGDLFGVLLCVVAGTGCWGGHAEIDERCRGLSDQGWCFTRSSLGIYCVICYSSDGRCSSA